MPLLASTIPALTLLAFVVVCVLPWGLSGSLGFVMPLMPFAVVYHWARIGMPLPSSVVFLAGFLVDVLTFGPLGYWPLVYLVGMAMTAGVARLIDATGLLGRWRDFALVVPWLAILGWLVASFYFITPIDGTPMILAVAAVIGFYPLVAGLLVPFVRLVDGPKLLNLHRKS